MIHTFLLKSGQWTLQGFWHEPNLSPIAIEGTVDILWSQPNWFTWRTTFQFKDREESSPVILTYRGYLSYQQRQYTFVLKHNLLGNLEGNGWTTPAWIIQRYWVLNDRKRRQGFETLYQEAENTYRFCSALSEGHQIKTTVEARLSRCSSSN
mgnify:CR=1 FL=1